MFFFNRNILLILLLSLGLLSCDKGADKYEKLALSVSPEKPYVRQQDASYWWDRDNDGEFDTDETVDVPGASFAMSMSVTNDLDYTVTIAAVRYSVNYYTEEGELTDSTPRLLDLALIDSTALVWATLTAGQTASLGKWYFHSLPKSEKPYRIKIELLGWAGDENSSDSEEITRSFDIKSQ